MRKPEVANAIKTMEQKALRSGQFQEPISTRVNPAHTVAIVDIPIQGDGTDTASNTALHTLRGEIVPQTVGTAAGAKTYVTGMTAGSKDFNDLMKTKAPIVFGFVLLMAFVLLLVTFRSIVIPLKAIVLNLLSVGAAYGVLVWVFQYGHLEKLLGFKSTGGVTSWLPMFLFVVLFGLSMDYHVFILSRIRELFDRRAEDRGRRGERHQADCGRGHERGDRDGRGVRDLRLALRARVQADGRRPRGRRADRRHARPGGAAAGDHEVARRLELVPAALARLAAKGRT